MNISPSVKNFRKVLNIQLRNLSKTKETPFRKAMIIKGMINRLGFETFKSFTNSRVIFAVDANGDTLTKGLTETVARLIEVDYDTLDCELYKTCPVTKVLHVGKGRTITGDWYGDLRMATIYLEDSVAALGFRYNADVVQLIRSGGDLNPRAIEVLNSLGDAERSELMTIFFKHRSSYSNRDISDRLIWLRNVDITEQDCVMATEYFLKDLRPWAAFQLAYYAPMTICKNLKSMIDSLLAPYSEEKILETATGRLGETDPLIYGFELRMRAYQEGLSPAYKHIGSYRTIVGGEQFYGSEVRLR